jgi:hypothetical protein
MHIIAIGWLYVTVLMALTEQSVVAGVLTFVFYGLAPVALVLWLLGTPARRRAASVTVADPLPHQPDRQDPQADQ